MAPAVQLQAAYQALHYAVPAIILAYYILSTTIGVCTLQALKSPERKTPRKTVFLLQAAVLTTYVTEAIMLVTDTLTNSARHSSQDSNIYTLSSMVMWMILTISLLGSPRPVWYPYFGSWIIAVVAEIVLIILCSVNSFSPDPFSLCQVTVQVMRLSVLTVLPTLLILEGRTKESGTDEESASLLGKDKTANPLSNDITYDSIPTTSPDEDLEAEDDKKVKEESAKFEKHLMENGNWVTYLRRFAIFIPFVWPSRQKRLQLNLLGILLCLIAERFLNVLAPRQLGIVIDDLSNPQANLPIGPVTISILLQGLASPWGLGSIHQLLWIPVSEYTGRSIRIAAHSHIMSLSRDFHTSKNSAEMIKSIEQGLAINGLLFSLLFTMLPTLIDLLVAYVYLYYTFGAYMALNVVTTTIMYFWTCTYFTVKQGGSRRRFQAASRKEAHMMYETVDGWDSVSYFSRIYYEQARYSAAVNLKTAAYQALEWFWIIVDLVEESLLQVGLYCACLLAICQIANGNQKVGSFAMLILYWGKFTGGLSYVAYSQKNLFDNIIDAEALLELFQITPSVKDGPAVFKLGDGAVRFDDVHFSYDRKREVLKGFNFNGRPGQKVALVGETGGGKSSVLRLLFRFYDVQTGRITIDGQDVRDVTVESLREYIGTVPQDPSLFNDSITNNVRYSRLDATDEDVVNACKAAAIHEKILTFSEGYGTKVGEKGVKLSGGELQRLAIARVILKDPQIVLLDEATSAVDTDTELKIQSALDELTRGRTTFMIAHRLSTVKNADVILVVKDGKICEQGSPHELLQAKGKYYDLWLKQFGVALPSDGKPADIGRSSDLTDENDGKHVAERSDASSASKAFRPDAPEFIPRHQRGIAAKGGDPSHGHGAAGHKTSHNKANGHDHGQGFKGGHSLGKVDRGLSNRNPKKKRTKDDSGQGSDAWQSDSRPNTADSGYDGPAQEIQGKPQKPYHKKQRRNLAKSEPNGSPLSRSQGDGMSDAPTPRESEGSQAMPRTQPRRVSAPSDPPLGLTTQGQRRRHIRYLRNRQLEQARSKSNTGSGEASASWSSDTLQVMVPPAPTTTPTKGVLNVDETKAPVKSSGGVHFPSGV